MIVVVVRPLSYLLHQSERVLIFSHCRAVPSAPALIHRARVGANQYRAHPACYSRSLSSPYPVPTPYLLELGIPSIRVYLDHKYKIDVLPDPESDECLVPWFCCSSFSLLVLSRHSQSSLPKLCRPPTIGDGSYGSLSLLRKRPTESRRSDFRTRARRSPRMVLPSWSTADMAGRPPLLLPSLPDRVESRPPQIVLTRPVLAFKRLPNQVNPWVRSPFPGWATLLRSRRRRRNSANAHVRVTTRRPKMVSVGNCEEEGSPVMIPSAYLR